jgi:hypothetical protein
MAYDLPYDGGFSRSLSRRPSMGYAVSAPAAYGHGGYIDSGVGSFSSLYLTLSLSHLDTSKYTPNSYSMYAPQPISRRLTGPSKLIFPFPMILKDLILTHSYKAGYDDNYDYGDSYYDDHHHSRSATPHSFTSYPHSSMISAPQMRHRRASGVSFAEPLSHRDIYSHYRRGSRPGSLRIKFKRKGAFVAGVGLDEAQSHTRLSNNDGYSLYDLHADSRGRILLKVKVSNNSLFSLNHYVKLDQQWLGYSSLTYEIPLDAYDGRVNLSTLARRVSRACGHYLQVR